MTTVSDAGPLIALAKLGQFDLLRSVFGCLLVPQAVYVEVVVRGAGRAGAAELQQAVGEWIDTRTVEDGPLVRGLLTQLGAGESQAIALAASVDADVLLLDDAHARAVAEFVGVHVVGSVGVLVQASRQGMMADLAQALRDMRAAGIWISDGVIDAAVRAARRT